MRKEEHDTLEKPAFFGERLLEECRQALKIVLPFKRDEKEFLDQILDQGEIVPSLLTSDTNLRDRIQQHPMLKWKAINVKKHKRIE